MLTHAHCSLPVYLSLTEHVRRKQIESLMAKLNESKQSERALKASVDDLMRERDGWQQRAEEANTEFKNAQALQNTIDHLENRLEIANIEKLDAAEQLLNFQLQRSPFDVSFPRPETVPQVGGDNIKVSRSQLHTTNTICLLLFSLLEDATDGPLACTGCASQSQHSVLLKLSRQCRERVARTFYTRYIHLAHRTPPRSSPATRDTDRPATKRKGRACAET